MEDVLETYHRTYTDEEVLVCLDETSKQHIKETRTPLPARPGEPEKQDFEYERNGVSNLFMLFAPLEGWRHVKVTDHHTREDWAQVIKELVDEHFPEKKKIVLVMDNLNTHKISSLYAAFKPEEARRRVAIFAKACFGHPSPSKQQKSRDRHCLRRPSRPESLVRHPTRGDSHHPNDSTRCRNALHL